MLIFVVPSSYPNSVNSQANIFVHEQCIALKNFGCEVVVLDATSYRWKYWLDKSCFCYSKKVKDGISVYSKHIRSLLKMRFRKHAVKQYRKVVNRMFEYAIADYGIPDIIYAHFTYPSGYVSCEISKKYNIPLAVMEHGGMYMESSVPRYIKKILRFTMNNADWFGCVSEEHKKCLYKWTNSQNKVHVVNNMISDQFRYHPLENKDTFVFFSAGNLYRVKRMDLLVLAFINCFSVNDKVCLRIAGDGSEREKIEELIKKNGREKQILLLGRLSRDDMFEEYKKCNVFALVSEHESFGIAYREAMAVGRPVISSDNGGISTGWNDDYGKIVPLNDVDSLSNAMLDIYNNFYKYNLKKISQECIEKFSAENVAKRLIFEFEKCRGEFGED